MLIPLIYTDSLPLFRISDLHVLPPAGRAAPPPPPELSKPQPRPASQRPEFRDPSKLYAYKRIPDQTPVILDPPTQSPVSTGPYVPGAIYDGRAAGTGILPSAASIAPPPPVAKATAPEPVRTAAPPAERIRVGSGVQEAKIITKVIPVYPALARQARVSGTVELLGVIARDGTVQHLQVISGHPLLTRAAVDAVRQWIYRPTLLNGNPVEVVSPIQVRFILN